MERTPGAGRQENLSDGVASAKSISCDVVPFAVIALPDSFQRSLRHHGERTEHKKKREYGFFHVESPVDTIVCGPVDRPVLNGRNSIARGGEARTFLMRVVVGKRRGQPEMAAPLGPSYLSQVAPVVELVGIFCPAVAYVGAVVHVGDQDVFDAGVNLGLGLLHGLAGADYREDYAGGAGD
ncbi:MAG: hypothetical protein JWO71_159 [Candidatus Acidoferrum typicum]|nr:hypothetical protein [Candidatus Acidoferrum typicum]